MYFYKNKTFLFITARQNLKQLVLAIQANLTTTHFLQIPARWRLVCELQRLVIYLLDPLPISPVCIRINLKTVTNFGESKHLQIGLFIFRYSVYNIKENRSKSSHLEHIWKSYRR